MKTTLSRLLHIMLREVGIMRSNPIYPFCMVVFPIVVTIYFTSLLNQGQPVKMPVGVVDLDNTSTTRSMVRRLDAFQTTKVVAYYNTAHEARKAMQRGQIYAYLYLPKGTTAELLANRQPRVAFYYTSTIMLAGSMLYRDLKTITTLGSAAVGISKLSALGKTSDEISTFLQPITLDLHMIGNPWMNYNVYLSTIMVPGILMMFIFLITAYSLGTELKFRRSRQLMKMAGGNIHVAVLGKIIPQFFIFLTIVLAYMWYLYGHLGFPHPGGLVPILVLSFLTVVSAQGFGIFMFGLMPSLRMSMSLCSLWAVLGFSLCGATFPLYAMDNMIEAMAQLFPLRHFYMIYQICIFNGFPLADAFWNVGCLVVMACLPMLVLGHIRKAWQKYVYIP